MPKIVEYTQQTAPSSLGHFPKAATIDQGGNELAVGYAQLSAGIQALGTALTKSDEEEARAWAAMAVSKSRLEWTTNLVNRQSTAAPGAPEFTPSLLKDFDEYSVKALENAPSGNARKFYQQRLADLRTEIGVRAVEFEASSRIDNRVNTYNEAISNVAKLMDTDPAQFEKATAEVMAVIDASDIPPIKKADVKEKGLQRIAEAAVWKQIQTNPGAWIDRVTGATGRNIGAGVMGVTGDKPFDALPHDKRVQMLEAAYRVKSQMETDKDRAAREQQRAASEAFMKHGWDLMQQGKLTEQYAISVKPFLSADQYHSLLVSARSAAEKDDPKVFSEIMGQLYGGRTEEATKSAYAAHRNKLIGNSTLQSILTKSHEISRQEGPKSTYERVRGYIVSSMDPGPLVQDPVGRARMAEALYEFDNWVNAAKRTDAEIHEEGASLLSRYKFINFQDQIIGLPQPRFGSVIPRTPGNQPAMLEAIKQGARKAEELYASGKITREQFDAEHALLNRWRKAIQGAGESK